MTTNDNDKSFIPENPVKQPDVNIPENDSVVFEEILSDLKTASENYAGNGTETPDGAENVPPVYDNTQEVQKPSHPVANGNRPSEGKINSNPRYPQVNNTQTADNAPDYSYRDIPAEKKPEKQKIKAEFSDLILLVFTAITVFTSLNASFFVTSGFVQSLILTAFIAFFTVLAVRKTKKFPGKAVFPGILSLISALSCCYTANLPFEKLVFLYYIFGMYCLALTGAKGYPITSGISFIHQLRAMLLIPVRKLFLPVTSVFRNKKIIPIGKIIGITSGVLLGIPVFIITAVLLSSGDILFSNVLTDALHTLFDRLKEFISLGSVATVVLTVLITPVLYSFLFSSKYGVVKETLGDNKAESAAGKIGFIPSSVMLGFYGIISVCYVTYLLSQFGYLISGFTGILPEGEYTLSLYARRGFFEMSCVAIINLGLIILGSVFTKRNKKKSLPLTYKFFSSFFCVFTIILIITAIAKMALYVTELGFTEKRIMVLTIDIILLIAFICALFKLVFKKFPYLRIITTVAFVILTVYCTVGTDAIISYYNTNMYLSEKHEEVHVSTIADTKDDWFKLTNLDKLVNDDDPTVSSDAKEALYGIYNDHIKDTTYSAHSMTDILCDSYLRKHSARFEEYSDYYFSSGTVYDTYGYSDYSSDYELIDLVILVEAADAFTSFSVSNDIVSAECNKINVPAFCDNDKILFTDWAISDHSDIVAEVTATGKDGKEYTFKINQDNLSQTEAPDVVYVGGTRYFCVAVGLKDDAIITKVVD